MYSNKIEYIYTRDTDACKQWSVQMNGWIQKWAFQAVPSSPPVPNHMLHTVLMVPFSLEHTNTVTARPSELSAFNCMTHSSSTGKVWENTHQVWCTSSLSFKRGFGLILFRMDMVKAIKTVVQRVLEYFTLRNFTEGFRSDSVWQTFSRKWCIHI